MVFKCFWNLDPLCINIQMPFINSSLNVHYFKKPIFSLLTYFSVSETLFQSSISKCLLICLSSHIHYFKSTFFNSSQYNSFSGDLNTGPVWYSSSEKYQSSFLFPNVVQKQDQKFSFWIIYTTFCHLKPDRLKSGFQLFSDFGCLVFESPTNCIFKPVLKQYRVPQQIPYN